MKLIFKKILPTLSFVAISSVVAFSQYSVPAIPEPAAPIIWGGGETSERSINVDAAVNLTLCVSQGNVKINGWNRNEVRVYVENGSKFGITVQHKSPKTGAPALIKINGVDTKTKYAPSTECIWAEEIEIDVPIKAVVNLKGQNVTTSIDGIRKANINTIGGDISLRKITDGISASTGQGGITVEESMGALSLDSTTGNIVVFDAAPSEIGDLFRAKTNGGMVSLQQIGHRQIEVGSISGSVIYNGTILSGGTYSFTTTNGSIRMSIPQNSSCQVSATYGSGRFNSEIPFKLITENISEGPVKNIVAAFGTGGDATLKLTTHNGSISIRRQ